MNLSILIPAKNEATSIAELLSEIFNLYPDSDVIVIDDGSSDQTKEISERLGAVVYSHPYSKGNGAAIKTGLRFAKHEVVVCMDADGQHQPSEIKVLLDKLSRGYDMVVGARSTKGQAGIPRSLANSLYNSFASWMVGHEIKDLTSGFRACYREKFIEFISLLPNKFSYPTTITMSFFRSGYSVAYVPISVLPRTAGTNSHISLTKDGVRFLLIIFKIGTLFSPLKIFFPISLGFFLIGFGYYLYTYLSVGRFTNMSALLFTTSAIIFLMGLVSEQITTLLYKDNNK